MARLNQTHDPARRSWVTTANDPACDFPLQNLPYCVFSRPDGGPRVGVAIGDQVVDLARLEAAGLLRPADAPVFDRANLNAFMALPPAVWSSTRAALSALLDAGNDRLRDDADLRSQAVAPLASATLHLPIEVRGFTDFYASREHATNVGIMFRGADKALMPNWLHVPIGYNGRASTVVISGTDIHRPYGQLKGPDDPVPRFAPCERLDIELEIGAIVGTPNAMGRPVTVAQAYDMIFGYVLLNDWSARDIQVWEYQPLGPFLSKAFATTISPFVVTREALEPYRVPAPDRTQTLLPYLRETAPNNFDMALTVDLAPAGGKDTTVSRTNFKHMYYSSAQQLAHHASSGCAMCTGDLLGSGTVSGSDPDSYGSLLELAWRGERPVVIDGGTRSFLADGDTVTLRGWCEGAGHRIGFGACVGTIAPAVEQPQWSG